MTSAATPTPSLQRRVTLIVVGLLAVVLLLLGAIIDVSVAVQARRNLHDRLLAATSRADALAAGGAAPAQLAAELNGGSVRALVVTADGATYGDPAISQTPLRPARPSAASAPPPPRRPPPPWAPPPTPLEAPWLRRLRHRPRRRMRPLPPWCTRCRAADG
ncbi:two component regulator sensor kinase domain protein [Mycobacterium xenopi 4042]|uniref:Two component regulator sensor kinase domain protein n=1 Tax=Mycobacterium xenopi 4042 TaxID=1299334 RepID=X7YQ28_MYCXE|nr:two component regulator sensor kinase domain protein [Mycobacterium xenopi 4042]